jgi:hypothetical protein
MGLRSVDTIKTTDIEEILRKRLDEKFPEQVGTFKDEDLAAELVIYKRERKVELIPETVKELIQNNSATIEAFPEAADNYSKWVEENILKEEDVDMAASRLQAIKDKETELFDRITAQTQKDALMAEIRIEFHAALVNVVKGTLAERGFKAEDIEEFKKCV